VVGGRRIRIEGYMIEGTDQPATESNARRNLTIHFQGQQWRRGHGKHQQDHNSAKQFFIPVHADTPLLVY